MNESRMNKEQISRLALLASPLVAYLRELNITYSTIVINADTIKIVVDEVSIPIKND